MLMISGIIASRYQKMLYVKFCEGCVATNPRGYSLGRAVLTYVHVPVTRGHLCTYYSYG